MEACRGRCWRRAVDSLGCLILESRCVCCGITRCIRSGTTASVSELWSSGYIHGNIWRLNLETVCIGDKDTECDDDWFPEHGCLDWLGRKGLRICKPKAEVSMYSNWTVKTCCSLQLIKNEIIFSKKKKKKKRFRHSSQEADVFKRQKVSFYFINVISIRSYRTRSVPLVASRPQTNSDFKVTQSASNSRVSCWRICRQF